MCCSSVMNLLYAESRLNLQERETMNRPVGRIEGCCQLKRNHEINEGFQWLFFTAAPVWYARECFQFIAIVNFRAQRKTEYWHFNQGSFTHKCAAHSTLCWKLYERKPVGYPRDYLQDSKGWIFYEILITQPGALVEVNVKYAPELLRVCRQCSQVAGYTHIPTFITTNR